MVNGDIFFKSEALLEHVMEGTISAYVLLAMRKRLSSVQSPDPDVVLDAKAAAGKFDTYDSWVPRAYRYF